MQIRPNDFITDAVFKALLFNARVYDVTVRSAGDNAEVLIPDSPYKNKELKQYLRLLDMHKLYVNRLEATGKLDKHTIDSKINIKNCKSYGYKFDEQPELYCDRGDCPNCYARNLQANLSGLLASVYTDNGIAKYPDVLRLRITDKMLAKSEIDHLSPELKKQLEDRAFDIHDFAPNYIRAKIKTSKPYEEDIVKNICRQYKLKNVVSRTYVAYTYRESNDGTTFRGWLREFTRITEILAFGNFNNFKLKHNSTNFGFRTITHKLIRRFELQDLLKLFYKAFSFNYSPLIALSRHEVVERYRNAFSYSDMQLIKDCVFSILFNLNAKRKAIAFRGALKSSNVLNKLHFHAYKQIEEYEQLENLRTDKHRNNGAGVRMLSIFNREQKKMGNLRALEVAQGV